MKRSLALGFEHYSKKYISPSSTELVVIIPYDSSTGFKRSLDLTELIEGRASYEEIDLVLKDFEEVISKHMEHKSIFEWIVSIIFLLLVIFVIVLIFSDLRKQFNHLLLYGIVVVTFGLAGLISFITGIRQAGKIEKAKAEALFLLESKYGDFQTKGVRWNVPAHFPKWIELWRDYIGDGSNPSLLSRIRDFRYYGPHQAASWSNHKDSESLQ